VRALLDELARNGIRLKPAVNGRLEIVAPGAG
jgi:hypothetical protein